MVKVVVALVMRVKVRFHYIGYGKKVITADNCRNGRVGFGRMRAGAIFGCHRNPTLERQILTRVGFEPELGFIDSG